MTLSSARPCIPGNEIFLQPKNFILNLGVISRKVTPSFFAADGRNRCVVLHSGKLLFHGTIYRYKNKTFERRLIGMKKNSLLFLFVAVICTALMTGCNGSENNADPAPTPSDKVESSENIPTLDEVISGTWSLHAGFEQSGELVYVSSDSAEYTFTFDADNGFSGVYRDSDGYISSTFAGIYDVTNSKAAYKNPYDWYYYALIEKDSIADSGESTLLGRLGEEGLHLIFEFRELDGEKLLYEQKQRLYFKR